jgi:hypothetical protein
MKNRRSVMGAVGVAAVLVFGFASRADAQCPSTYNGTVRWGINNAGQDDANVCGTTATVDIWARVLSGSSFADQAMFFLGVDGAASTLANIVTPGSGVAIPLNKPIGCFGGSPLPCVWDGTPYPTTFLGNYAVGTKLVFGLRTFGTQWLVSSNTWATTLNMYHFGQQTDASGNLLAAGMGVYDDTRRGMMPPPVQNGDLYGWDDGGAGPCGPFGGTGPIGITGCATPLPLPGVTGGADYDYQDLVFELRTDVLPEPASVALLATGLIGLGGVALRRRSSK